MVQCKIYVNHTQQIRKLHFCEIRDNNQKNYSPIEKYENQLNQFLINRKFLISEFQVTRPIQKAKFQFKKFIANYQSQNLRLRNLVFQSVFFLGCGSIILSKSKYNYFSKFCILEILLPLDLFHRPIHQLKTLKNFLRIHRFC